MGKAKKTTKSTRMRTAKKTSAAKSGSTAKKSPSAKKRPAAPVGDSSTASVDRRSGQDRRKSSDRRKQNKPVATERRQVERRVKVNRRRQIDPTTCERDYTPDEIEFMGALDEYKRTSGRMFPTCSEILEVIRDLGYVKQPKAEAAAEPAAVLPSAPAPTTQGSQTAAV